jgi:hypothetical protein
MGRVRDQRRREDQHSSPLAQPPSPPCSHRAARVEHEYSRARAWAYLATLDVHRAKIFGRCEKANGIDPFDRLVAQVMTQPPYRDARRVFWIMDNGSSHRGQPCVKRLTHVSQRGPRSRPDSRELAQPDRDLLLDRPAQGPDPNGFSGLEDVKDRLLGFQEYYESLATPFDWRFTREDLTKLNKKFVAEPSALRHAA